MSETDTPDERSEEDRARAEAQPAQQVESDTSAAQAPADDQRDDGAGSGRVALIVAVVALIIALLAIVAAAALWYFGDRPTGHMAATVTDVQHRLDREASALDDALQRLQALQGVAQAQDRQGKHLQQVDRDMASLKQRIGEIRMNVTRLTDLVRTGQRSWGLIEVEHLLEVANSRLLLRRDVDGAVTALTLAQHHLARLDDPSLYGVRKAVQASITNLRAVPVPDVEGMSLTLSSLAEAVPRLPLKRGTPAEFQGQPSAGATAGGESQPWWARGWHSIVSALRGVVTVRRSDKPSAALLAPRHEYFLYQNLQLKLEAARLSLLQRDEAGFRTSIATSLDWLNTYFDPDAAAVKAMKSQLSDLGDARLAPVLPDISAGLERVRERLDALRKVSFQPPSDQQKPSSDQSPQNGHDAAEQPPSRQSPAPARQGAAQPGQPQSSPRSKEGSEPTGEPATQSGQSTPATRPEQPEQAQPSQQAPAPQGEKHP